MNERMKFIADVLKGKESITQLCLRYAISRKTGYKWMERFQHPTWGARKLQARLEQTRGDTDWPTASTINGILPVPGCSTPRSASER